MRHWAHNAVLIAYSHCLIFLPVGQCEETLLLRLIIRPVRQPFSRRFVAQAPFSPAIKAAQTSRFLLSNAKHFHGSLASKSIRGYVDAEQSIAALFRFDEYRRDNVRGEGSLARLSWTGFSGNPFALVSF